MYSIVEPCCGSAAFSLFMLGAKRPLLPYQGGKWRYRKPLAALFREVGARGLPRRVELYDAGPWGVVAGLAIRADSRAGIIDQLDLLSRFDSRQVFDALQGSPVPEDGAVFSAQYLFLQRLSYSGKAVGVRDGKWHSPGFNTSSAYGLAATDRFGHVNPMIPSLIKTLRSYSTVVTPERLVSVQASAHDMGTQVFGKTIVYLDPPYAGSTDYPNGDLDRESVLSLARKWFDAGAFVVISESESLADALGPSWTARMIYEGRGDTSPFRGKQEEWVTLSPQWS